MSLRDHVYTMTLDARLDVRVEEAVTFAFTVTNATTEHVELRFRDGQTADVVLRDADADAGVGGPVWRWSDGRAFTQALRTETLGPGDSVSHVVEWSDPPDGEYTAEATLAATEHDLADRRSFSVPE